MSIGGLYRHWLPERYAGQFFLCRAHFIPLKTQLNEEVIASR